MSSNIYSVGLRNVGSYEVSGVPWIGQFGVSGSSLVSAPNDELNVKFPYVAKSVTIRTIYGLDGSKDAQTAYDMRMHLASVYDGSTRNQVQDGLHFWLIEPQGKERTFTGKFKELFFSMARSDSSVYFELYAELTNIPTSSMYTLSGSGINQ